MRIAAAFIVAVASAAQAQMFSVLPSGHEPAAAPAWSVPGPRPVGGCIVRVDIPALSATLGLAPAQRLDARLADYGMQMPLPGPGGDLVPCFVAESPVIEAPLQGRFPQIRSFIVQSVDGRASGRLELTQRGLTAMLRAVRPADSPHASAVGDTWMIDIWQSGDPAHAAVYWLRDLNATADWTCHTAAPLPQAADRPEALRDPAQQDDGSPSTRGGGPQLSTVRIAMACTGEYGLHQCAVLGHAPNIADPLAAIVTVVSRANVVYEADLAVHFNLVSNNDQIVFIDPETDPYPTTCDGTGGGDCSGPFLSVNIQTLSSLIGNSNFDIGHLLTRVYGGVAYLNALCTSNKAGGISGIPRGGDVDPLSALIAIHELGHQFGANHTFSGTRGRCFGNVNLSTAWEAGSGSSPMAYAGGCPVGDAPPTDNVVQFCDPYFHHGSVREMMTLLGNRTCPVRATVANNPPVIVSTTADQAIPPGTPFALSVLATDADGDALTCSWEQYDSGFARPLTGPDAFDNGQGALFRAFSPVLSATRTFPRMADVLSGVPTPGEMLPAATGVTRRFRVIVRDNFPGAGGVAISPFVRLTIATGATPFSLLAPVAGTTLAAGPNQVLWSVGGTDQAPISCGSVTARLSLDDGLSFDRVLGTFPNSGAAIVQLPPLVEAAAARIRVDADGRAFFAVSAPFTLDRGCIADFDGAGGVGVPDIFAFLAAWFAQDPRTDIDGIPGIAVPDIFAFLSLWFAGCV